MTTRLLTNSAVFCAAFALLLVTETARASCNVIPDSQQTIGGTPQGQIVASTIPSDLSYRGALGRIDTAIMVSELGSSIVVGPDEECGGRPLRPQGTERPVQPDNLVVRLAYSPGAEKSVVQFYASPENCETILPKPPKDRRDAVVHCDPARDNIAIGSDDGGKSYRLKINGSRYAVPGPVSVVVVAATREEMSNLSAEKLAKFECESFAADSRRNADRHICIDTIYDDYIDRCEVGPKFAAIVPSNLLNMPPANDFEEQCFNLDDADTSLEDCEGNPTELALITDDSGAVHIPFDWTTIIEKKDKSLPTIERIVAGLTGTGRKEKAKDPEIWIPGREFLGSTPLADPAGEVTDFRKPEMGVWRPAGHSNEIGFIGVVDKVDSIVHVYPRISVGWLCDSFVAQDEACMAVEQFATGGVEICAAQDRSGLGPTCEALLIPQFAACSGGPYDQMPCTRPQHCGFLGFCNGAPKCQKKGEVWEPNKNKGSNACKIDGDCKATEQCGYSLFDLEDRSGKHLTAKIKNGAGNKPRRGVCKDAPGDVCSNAGGGNSCGSNTDCIGFHLEAHGEK